MEQVNTNQLCVYGAIADWCQDLAVQLAPHSPSSTATPVANVEDDPASQDPSADVSNLTKFPMFSIRARGDSIRQYLREIRNFIRISLINESLWRRWFCEILSLQDNSLWFSRYSFGRILVVQVLVENIRLSEMLTDPERIYSRQHSKFGPVGSQDHKRIWPSWNWNQDWSLCRKTGLNPGWSSAGVLANTSRSLLWIAQSLFTMTKRLQAQGNLLRWKKDDSFYRLHHRHQPYQSNCESGVTYPPFRRSLTTIAATSPTKWQESYDIEVTFEKIMEQLNGESTYPCFITKTMKWRSGRGNKKRWIPKETFCTCVPCEGHSGGHKVDPPRQDNGAILFNRIDLRVSSRWYLASIAIPFLNEVWLRRKDSKEGRQTVCFTAVDPMNEPQRDEPHDVKEPREVPYRMKWNVHRNAVLIGSTCKVLRTED